MSKNGQWFGPLAYREVDGCRVCRAPGCRPVARKTKTRPKFRRKTGYGVKSAMPMFKALRACPDAVVIKSDFAKYTAVSRQVRALMEA